jgi:hypothetical protein
VRRRVAGSVVGVVAVLGLSSSPALGGTDPCLLTPAEIERAAGIEVEQDFRGSGECSYTTPVGTEPGGGVGILTLETDSRQDAKSELALQKELYVDAVRVKGVGDGAFYVHNSGFGDVVMFRKGSMLVQVSFLIVSDESPGSLRRETVALAKAVAKKL